MRGFTPLFAINTGVVIESPVFERACCKINLGLEVLRKRPDGYHDINTVFAELQLSDAVVVGRAVEEDVQLTVEGSDILAEEPSEENLCMKAARACIDAGFVDSGIAVTLTKQIPTGGGLGGGSSDAAAVLRACVRLASVAPSRTQMQEIASGIGSDVPFFLDGGIALGTGTGTHVEQLDLRLPWSVLLVKPTVSINTTSAYGSIELMSDSTPTNLSSVLTASLKDRSILRKDLVNDFEPGLFSDHPELAQIKEGLYDHGAFFALMSGSGSSLFGLFETEHQATAARSEFKGNWTCVTRFRGEDV